MAGRNSNTLKKETREQIAIGVSLAVKCQPCLQHHLKMAKRIGVTDEAIEEVIRLTRQIRAAAEEKMDDFVGLALNEETTNAVHVSMPRMSAESDGGENQGCCS